MRRISDWLSRVPRWALYSGVGVVFAAAGAGLAAGVSAGGDDPSAVPSATPQAEASAGPAPSASPVEGIQPGDIIAATNGVSIPLYANPGDATKSRDLPQWTDHLQPLTLMGLDAAVVDGKTWYLVQLPGKPNDRRGWIRAEDVTVTSTDLSIHVYIKQRELEVWRGDEVVLTTRTVVGDSDTPTPIGLFYVSDALPFANPTGIYGAYALGLSAYSEVLDEFNGGAPQIAIHGTTQTNLLGQAVSNGCIRVPNKSVLKIADLVPVGTPVYLEAERTVDNSAPSPASTA